MSEPKEDAAPRPSSPLSGEPPKPHAAGVDPNGPGGADQATGGGAGPGPGLGLDPGTTAEAPEPDSIFDESPGGRRVSLDQFEAGVDSLSAAAAMADSETGPLDEEITALRAQVQSLEDQRLRLAADVQNTVRRAERDRRDAETYGGTKLARDLLSVYDNLESAIELASDELREKEPGFFNGVALTRDELVKAFAKHKIERIQPEIGEKFDPNHHQAMYEAPVPGATPGSVIQIAAAGFKIADRLLRPAMVGVASAGSTPPTGADGSEAASGDVRATSAGGDGST